VRRVELTHDVLCGVVKSSRDLRRERESREATERLLAEQNSREVSARRALVSARRVAIGCTILAVGALTAPYSRISAPNGAPRRVSGAADARGVRSSREQAERLLATHR